MQKNYKSLLSFLPCPTHHPKKRKCRLLESNHPPPIVESKKILHYTCKRQSRLKCVAVSKDKSYIHTYYIFLFVSFFLLHKQVKIPTMCLHCISYYMLIMVTIYITIDVDIVSIVTVLLLVSRRAFFKF